MDFTFGKYKGQQVEKVFLKDPEYIGWCLEKGLLPDFLPCAQAATDAYQDAALYQELDGILHESAGCRD